MKNLRAISINHNHFPLETIGQFTIAEEALKEKLNALKAQFELDEIMYLGTCNRVEFIFTVPHFVCPGFTQNFLLALNTGLPEEQVKAISKQAMRLNGDETADHIFRVASSLDSLIIGEREIITQLRTSYEVCEKLGTTGDAIRLLIQSAIRIAKDVYTHTNLSKKPVSVVSIAWRLFQEQQLHHNARIVLVGAGQTVRNFVKFLAEHNYNNVAVFNRSLDNAQSVAAIANGSAHELSALKQEAGDFDALVVCTWATDYIVTESLFHEMASNDKKRVVIDISLPANVDPKIQELEHVHWIDMQVIQEEVKRNISYREEALEDCLKLIEQGKEETRKIFQERHIERAMSQIPATIRDIKNMALDSVFQKEMAQLDPQSRELIEKIIGYMEKKYISVPMKMAKDVLLSAVQNN